MSLFNYDIDNNNNNNNTITIMAPATATAPEYYVGDASLVVDSLSSETSTSSSQALGVTNPDFNPKVFWSVNAFILFLIVLSGVWCCFVQKYFFNNEDPLNRSERSDELYRARRRRRLEAETKNNTECPEKRRTKLLASFAKHKVQMTVRAEDLITGDEDDDTESDTTCNACPNDTTDLEAGDASNCNCNSVGMGMGVGMGVGNSTSSLSLDSDEKGYLKLRDRTGRLVPNCCAVCLSGYRPGDVVTWSSNIACTHAFHRECVLDWLIKKQPDTPCPTCRQEFTDLEKVRKERKISWVGTFAFDFSAVQLW